MMRFRTSNGGRFLEMLTSRRQVDGGMQILRGSSSR